MKKMLEWLEFRCVARKVLTENRVIRGPVFGAAALRRLMGDWRTNHDTTDPFGLHDPKCAHLSAGTSKTEEGPIR